MIRKTAEASTEFTPFAGRFNNLPAWRNENIRVALRTDGVSPVTKANAQRTIIVINIRRTFNLRFIKNNRLRTNILSIMACRPDTAIICITPALIKFSF